MRVNFSAHFMNGESCHTVPDGMLWATSSFPSGPTQAFLWEQQTLQNRGQEQTLDMLEEYSMKPVTSPLWNQEQHYLCCPVTPPHPDTCTWTQGKCSRFFPPYTSCLFLTFSSTYTLFSPISTPLKSMLPACHLHSVHCWVPGRAPGAGKLLLTFQELLNFS